MILAEPTSGPQILATAGEAEAARLLRRHGLRILHRRYRTRRGEIDLVALDGAVVVFVEVKTRSGVRYGLPAAAVTPRKQARIARAALSYLTRFRLHDRTCRFDVVEVRRGPRGELSADHIRDAFRLWPTG